jgi:hypothetical protein
MMGRVGLARLLRRSRLATPRQRKICFLASRLLYDLGWLESVEAYPRRGGLSAARRSHNAGPSRPVQPTYGTVLKPQGWAWTLRSSSIDSAAFRTKAHGLSTYAVPLYCLFRETGTISPRRCKAWLVTTNHRELRTHADLDVHSVPADPGSAAGSAVVHAQPRIYLSAATAADTQERPRRQPREENVSGGSADRSAR